MDVDTPPTPPKPAPTTILSYDDDDDADPIIASYNVFTNPPLPSTRKLLILQYPNKSGPVSEPYHQISEVRLKASSGMIEVDVPVNYQDPGYDRDKGMRWGTALQKSMGTKSGGSHGLAGGFGLGVPAARGGGGGKRGEDKDVYDWSEAVRQDKVLRTQTLGGMYAQGEDCRWMVGVFKGGNLHLTPANSEVQLRPAMHHLDAQTEQERLARPREGMAVGAAGGPEGKVAAPKAITMTVKSAAGNEVTTETMTDRLRHTQMENWQRLKYVGEEEDEAWTTYDKTLLFRGKTGKADSIGKGKMNAEDADLEKEAVKLKTAWAEEDLLRAVAGKDREGVLEGYGSTAAGGVKEEGELEVVKTEESERGLSDAVKKATVKGKGKAAAPTSSALKKATGARAKP